MTNKNFTKLNKDLDELKNLQGIQYKLKCVIRAWLHGILFITHRKIDISILISDIMLAIGSADISIKF